MTASNRAGSPPATGDGRARQARDEAAQVGQHAVRAGGEVTQQAAEQGRQVMSETNRQAHNLMGQASGQLREQAHTQQKRVAEGLRGIGQELQSMASKSEQPGMATDVVRRASAAAQQAAGWLDEREPGAVIDEVRDYARRHPGAFLAGAAVAGMLVGRLTRNMSGSAGGSGGQLPEGEDIGHGRGAGMPDGGTTR